QYIIDPDLGKAFGVKYDTLNCEKFGQLFAGPAQPSAQYYLAVGAQAVYNSLAVEPAVAETLERLPAYAEIELSAAVMGAIVPTAILSSAGAFQAIARYAGRAFLLTAEAGAEVAGFEFTAGVAASGVFAIVGVALLILIQGAIDFSEKQQVIDG